MPTATNTLDAIVTLRHLIPRNTRVLVLPVHVNREGTSRQMRVVCTSADLAPQDVTELVAQAVGSRMGKHGVIVRGTGMDMRYHLLTSLSSAIHGEYNVLRLA